jgi:molybdopterin synthase catalytic subunit
MRSAIVDREIELGSLVREVARNANGATLLFIGTVRDVNNGRAITGMEYSAYREMAERELADIVREASAQFETEDIVVEHRLGALGLGDASVSIAVAHAHRGPAYEASRYVIEQLKQRVPIWKLEYYVDGSREWVGSNARIRGASRAVHDPAGATVQADLPTSRGGDVA